MLNIKSSVCHSERSEESPVVFSICYTE